MSEVTDMTDGWVIDSNDAAAGEPENWVQAWETWFVEDDREADRLEKEYAKAGKKFVMTPRPAVDLIELLKKLRPDRKMWVDYRLRNVATGDVILAWVLK